jgi:arginine N-succinyltransferase
MIIVRPINRKDHDIFVEFSFSSALGMRNLPRDKEQLLNKIARSEYSFSHRINKPNSEEYFFVLEDRTTGRIGGTCGILAHLDHKQCFPLQIQTIYTGATHPSTAKELKILKRIKPPKHISEVCSLYLQPTFRHGGQGRLLSLSRFLFIACHRCRFEKTIAAELRGIIDQRQISPFWKAVGSHFCHLSFVELMAQLELNQINIQEILPKYPIYLSLLPQEAQEVIGKTHEHSQAALHMLLQEGFKLSSYIDALEAGPMLLAATKQIRSIKNSRVIQIEITSDSLVQEPEFILSNERLAFRACYGNIQFANKNKRLINQEVAEALQVKSGDFIRYVALH